MFTKYEADLLCQKITYINTKGRGVRISHPVFVLLESQFVLEWVQQISNFVPLDHEICDA